MAIRSFREDLKKLMKEEISDNEGFSNEKSFFKESTSTGKIPMGVGGYSTTYPGRVFE
mgnify:CR=1 FL=1